MNREKTERPAWRLVRVRSRLKRRWVVLAVAGVLVVGGGTGWFVYGSPALAVESVEVSGATFTDVEDVRAAAKVPAGTALATVDADAVAERVAQLPEVRRVSVVRDWPHTVVVEIVERSPRLAVPDGKKFILVDEFGVAYRTVSERPGDAVLAKLKDPGREDPSTAAVLTVTSALTPKLENILVEVDAEAATRVTLELEDGRTVFWGDASESDRKAEVATVLLQRSEKHIDVSAPDVPTVS
ncbi:MAG: cell division protein FtsQ/DivIB [Stackebrandtia sp.]